MASLALPAAARGATMTATTDVIPNPDGRLLGAARAIARLGLALGLASAAAALAAGPAYRLQWSSLAASFMVLRWATYGAIATSIVGALTWMLLTLPSDARVRVTAAAAALLGLFVALPPLCLYSQAQQLPKIHDISTDTDDPPSFVEVLPLRRGAPNPVDYRPGTAEQQRHGYPDIAPLRLDLPPAQAFDRAERAARAMGWEIVAVRPDAGRIEATDTTLMFGFKDDIVIRVRAQSPGSVVDVRSLSRIGGSDIGANARRVRAYLRKVATR